ncbi:hypothetical protein SK128_023666, partial [Halocaridina rubra]
DNMYLMIYERSLSSSQDALEVTALYLLHLKALAMIILYTSLVQLELRVSECGLCTDPLSYVHIQDREIKKFKYNNVLVLLVTPLQAVPIRNHGGVIYSEDFLRILDPRTRSTTVSTALELEHSASMTSTVSVANVLENVNAPKQKSSSTLRSLPAASSSTNTFDRKKSAIDFRNNSNATTPRNNRLHPSTVPSTITKNNHADYTPSSTSKDLAPVDVIPLLLYDDYDYYSYYYMDDFILPSERPNTKSSNVDGTTLHESTRSILSEVLHEGSGRINKTSIDAPKSNQTDSKFQAATPRIVTLTQNTPVSTEKDSITEPTTTSRPSTTQLHFRYQVSTDATIEKVPSQNVSMITETKAAHDILLENSTVSSTENRKDNNATSSQAASTKLHLSSILNSTHEALSLVNNKSSSVDKDTVSDVLNTENMPQLMTIPVPQDKDQKAKRPRNNNGRFRYTTPLPKVQNETENTSDVTKEKTRKNENTIQKSLGSSSSLSVVVEVRVETSKPEPPNLVNSQSPLVVQTLSQNNTKETTMRPRTVHTVIPDHHTSSFLLSDSLVVDVVRGPKTSTHNTREQRQQESSTRIQRNPTSPTVKESSPESLPLQQNKEELSSSHSASSPDTLRHFSNKTEQTQSQEPTSNLETQESNITKSELAINDPVEPSIKNNTHSDREAKAIREVQTQSQSVSTSVSRTVVRTHEEIATHTSKPTMISTTTMKPSTATTVSGNTTAVPRETLTSANRTQSKSRARIPTPKGLHPQGLSPFGLAPGGLAPFGIAPEGFAPQGLRPTGLHPHGLSPQGKATNISSNATTTNRTSGLTLVDATVAGGGADANNSVGYVAVEHNISRFRHEEKTHDGFIVGEYGEVDHFTGDVSGVRYIAVDNADPNLIYDSLIQFLNLNEG